MTKNNYTHWHLKLDDKNIVWLYIDKAETSTNTLSADLLDELDAIIDDISKDSVEGLIILSDKKNGFVAGADVKEFSLIKNIDDAEQLIHRGQAVFDRIENLPLPTLALIHGFCLGGGLELALACRYRIADSDASTKLGLPEVKLGIHPGFGGTVRLPRLIGAPSAMNIMLTGRALSARAAKKIGLIDYAVPTRQLLDAARDVILNRPAQHKPKYWQSLSNHHLIRPWLAKLMRKQVAKKAIEKHYPAPYIMIDLWEKYTSTPRRLLTEERRSLARLVLNDTAQNLIRVFFLQERLKSTGNKEDFSPHRVHVIGGGVMGGDIAAWCALKGLHVTLQDHNHATLAKVIQRAAKLYKKRLKQPRLVQAALDRLVPDKEGMGLSQADVVIEAIFEDVDAKKSLYKEIEPKMKAGALLATNTSSIPLEQLGEALSEPDKLVGLHFFNPVAMMPLIEIVHGKNTDPEVIKKATAFARHIDRLPLPVSSTPGFLVNRILMPYLLEAVVMESEGIPAMAIDRAALDFGMPMGPIELADTVGLDICLSVAEILAQHYGATVPDRLKKLVSAGKLGKKSGEGFYDHKNKKSHRPKLSDNSSDIEIDKLADRMMSRLLKEAEDCLRDGVVEDADLLDAGVIFGTGFAPFRGGPLNYINSKKKDSFPERQNRDDNKNNEEFVAQQVSP